MSSVIRLSERPANWKDAAPGPLPNSTTFAAQERLPRLPVPNLEDTLNRLKESLKPIAWSEEQYNTVCALVDEFGKGSAPELQKRLLERYDNTTHWLEKWWDDGGYLGYRDSVVVNVSYYYGFHSKPSQTPARRAAELIRATMLFRQALKRGLIKPEATKEGPFCMDTYRWMFDCCRLPGPQGLDWSETYATEGDQGDTGHIVVFRKNQPWKVATAHNGRILSTDELQTQIEHIYNNTAEEGPGVGVLTSNNRDIWAKDYNELASSPNNTEILHAIQSAAFTLSLDTDTPSTPESFSRALWHGTLVTESGALKPKGLRNRWVDKPVQFIVHENGEAGIMGEHSVMDGTPTARMCDDVLDMLSDPAFDHGSPATSTSAPTPQLLEWEISSATSQAIASAEQAATELTSSQELGFYRTSYGKAAIKKFGVSPDSWAQMIVQLAYARLIGGDMSKRNGGTYEAASTRKFFKGRTETIRVVSSESDAWVSSMDDPKMDNMTRKELFDKATRKHVERAKMGGNAQGVDRHMFGLKKLLQEGEEVPALYNDPVYKRSSYWVLSTSAVFSKHFAVYGWGEVVPDGFGICYMTGFDDYLQYTITSRAEMPNAQLKKEIIKASQDLYDLHAELQQQKKALL